MAAQVLTFVVTEPDGREVPFTELADAMAHRRACKGRLRTETRAGGGRR